MITLVLLGAFVLSPAINYKYLFSNPIKITDPNDPDFDPLRFNFNDYDSYSDLAEMLSIILPVGKSRADVERIFVGAGNAKIIGPQSIEDIVRTGKFPDKEGYDWGHGYQFYGYFDDFHPAYRVKYYHPSRVTKFSWLVTAYYDEQDKLMLLIVKDEIVHPEVLKIPEGNNE